MSTINPENILNPITKDGVNISPLLPEGTKNYLIDIDGTICDDLANEEFQKMKDLEAYPDAISKINSWYEEGHVINFFTSRNESLRELTTEWLLKNGFKYHNLIMGKPRGGNYHWIDSHKVESTRYKNQFREVVRKGLTPKDNN